MTRSGFMKTVRAVRRFVGLGVGRTRKRVPREDYVKDIFGRRRKAGT